MKLIPLTKDLLTIVNDEDYDWLKSYRWCASKKYANKYYAVRKAKIKDYNNKQIFMHREILGLIGRLPQVDHINRNSLDNRRENLRICTSSENQANSKPRLKRSSKYRGVYWKSSRNKWVAQITLSRKTKYLGCFSSERDAALVYDKEANRVFGQFATLNFPGR